MKVINLTRWVQHSWAFIPYLFICGNVFESFMEGTKIFNVDFLFGFLNFKIGFSIRWKNEKYKNE